MLVRIHEEPEGYKHSGKFDIDGADGYIEFQNSVTPYVTWGKTRYKGKEVTLCLKPSDLRAVGEHMVALADEIEEGI